VKGILHSLKSLYNLLEDDERSRKTDNGVTVKPTMLGFLSLLNSDIKQNEDKRDSVRIPDNLIKFMKKEANFEGSIKSFQQGVGKRIRTKRIDAKGSKKNPLEFSLQFPMIKDDTDNGKQEYLSEPNAQLQLVQELLTICKAKIDENGKKKKKKKKKTKTEKLKKKIEKNITKTATNT